MTILNTSPRNQYTATAAQTTFPYTFEVFSDTDIAVEKNGALMALGADYAVSSVGNDNGGNVTLIIGATAADIITIYRDMALERLNDYQQNGDFLASEVNDDFDRLWAAQQQINSSATRSIRPTIDDAILNNTNTELAAPSIRGGKALGFTNSGELDYLSSAVVPVGTFTNASTTTAMTLLSGLSVGDVITTAEFSTGNGGGGTYDAVLTSSVTPNTFNILIGVADPLISFVLRNIGGEADMTQWGLVGDGVTSNTSQFSIIYPLVKSLRLATYFPSGTFKGKFTFDGGSPVRGAGMKQTVFLQEDEINWTVRLFSSGGLDTLGATLRDCRILSVSGLGNGLNCGDTSGSGNGFSNGLIERLEIEGFDINWEFFSAVMCSFNDIYSLNATTVGIKFGSETNVTTCLFNTCRFRLCDTGLYALAGHNIVWNNCNWESNRVTGLHLITGVTSGPTSWVFNGGDAEDNGAAPGGASAAVVASVVIDMNATIATTKPQSILFNRFICNGGVGAFDVSAVRAQNVIFDHCQFSRVADGGLTQTKMFYNTGTNAVRIKLIQCGTVQELPSESMYSTFPAVTVTNSSERYGFFYEFQDTLFQNFSNVDLSVKGIKVVTSDLTSFDVAGVRTIIIDSGALGFAVNSLSNGVNGQVIRFIKPTSANTVTLVHNGVGTGKIFMKAAASVALNSREGAEIVHYNGTWYEATK